MTRTEWKAFMHKLRADCAAFRDAHGGYPCFRHVFWHNGAEYTVTRLRDYGTNWQTYTRASIIRQRPAASLIHSELDCAANFRRKAARHHWTKAADLRGAFISIKIAREWRLERDSGFLDAQRARLDA